VLTQEEIRLKATAKTLAKQAAVVESVGHVKQGAKSTILAREIAKLKERKELPNRVGKHIRELDTALLGKHTLLLYNSLKWEEANVLVQLRTRMSRLNRYLR
jgi:hypothetical protein